VVAIMGKDLVIEIRGQLKSFGDAYKIGVVTIDQCGENR